MPGQDARMWNGGDGFERRLLDSPTMSDHLEHQYRIFLCNITNRRSLTLFPAAAFVAQ